jgi:hypothetical protein
MEPLRQRDDSMPRRDEWSDDEIILAIASCPREKQSYSPRHRNVIELADLIGRTPGAVSLHFANISHLIFGGAHGKTHVGERTRELFEEYRGREAELQARASEIRKRLMAQDFTPRVEKQVSRDATQQLTLDAFAAAKEIGLPQGTVETYEREGSWFFGVLMKLGPVVASHPEQASRFANWLLEKLGRDASVSVGFTLAGAGKWRDLVDGVLSVEAPELHEPELSPKDRLTLAIRIQNSGYLRRWKPTKGHLQLLSTMDRSAEKARVGRYLHIDAGHLCDMCLLMLKDFVDHSLKKDGAKTA